MLQKITIALILICLFILKANAQPTESAYHVMLRGIYKKTVPFIKVDELGKKLKSTSETKPVLLDTRSQKEFDVSHLEGARLVNYESFAVEQLKDLPEATHIVVYCSVGYRSERVGEQLKKAGYVHVYNLYGGLFEWVNKGYPVYNSKGQTNDVHAYSRTWGFWLNKGNKIYE